MDNERLASKQIASIVRAMVGAKVDAGTLPLAGQGRTVVLRGTGQACSACDDAIAAADMELAAESGDPGTGLRFHLECFTAWWTVTWSRRGGVS